MNKTWMSMWPSFSFTNLSYFPFQIKPDQMKIQITVQCEGKFYSVYISFLIFVVSCILCAIKDYEKEIISKQINP